VAVPMVTALALVGTPPLQFPAVFQLLSPAVPVHESAVRGGGAIAFVRFTAAAPVAGRAPDSDCCESFRFDPAAPCAKAELLRLKRAAARQRAVIGKAMEREDAGRMGDSEREIYVPVEPVRGTMLTTKSPVIGRWTGILYLTPHSLS
jgi:hypothetical protein